MSVARWTLRLPRATEHIVGKRITRQAVRRVEQQRRWIQKPPPRPRPWAGKPENHEDDSKNQIQQPQESQPPDTQPQQPGRNAQLATTLAESDTSDLLAEVHIPDDPHSVLPRKHPALSLLGNSSLVIQRQLEMMNVMLGFEQANRYIIMDGQGQTVGYIAERDHGIGSAVARQMFKTHRSFTTYIFDAQEREVLRIHRPFAYINSRIRIYDPVPEGGYEAMESSTDLQGVSAASVTQQGGSAAQVSPLKLEEMRIIGEAQQQWAPLRRKYNLFSYRPLTPANDETSTPPRIPSGEKASPDTTALTESKVPDQAIEAGMSQFAHVNEPFLSWDFNLRDQAGSTVGSVNRNFGGFAREIFTDTGVYALRMDSAAQSSALETAEGEEVGRFERDATAMTLDQRAVMLATAVSIDFDYFSRHSGAGSAGFMPFFWPWGGGAAAEGAGAGAAGGAVGAAEGAGAVEGVAGAAGAAGRGLGGAGAGESGIAAAGTMAGYEAMQRGAYGGQGNPANEEVFDPDHQSPTQDAQGGQQQQSEQQESSWGDEEDPWGGGGPGDGSPPPPSAGAEGGGGGDGGSWTDSLSDFFGDS
ncbi:hypothetical protein LTR56_007635 [Elasticomyces elasticus]|nr:hypothetical protein LTR56_007635 [Elasticomyces elasticus]KAK3665336.1 hypothetical protein LTR22_003858 [Elasticomyces elasticus]KAK4929691.1 hypothetical protein LTR49_003649 [Elasticomyces elasticus]KAK5761089.1 hypothetical protein LTS12_008766 [Elasticomyces elasticus]